MSNRETFPKALAYYMKKANVNNRELANAVGKSESTVHCWLNKKAFPRIDVIQKVADVLSCSTDDLLAPPQNMLSFPNPTISFSAEDIAHFENMFRERETNAQIRERQHQNVLKLQKIFESLSDEGQEYLLQQADIAKKMFKKE